MSARIEIDYKAFHKAFRSDARYRRYLKQLAEEAIAIMIAEFNAVQNFDNEELRSPTTLPKYVQSFDYEIDETRGVVYIYNDDPGWNLVEWGAHAFDKVWVLGYKPMTRALSIMAKRPPPRRNMVDPDPTRRYRHEGTRSDPKRFKSLRDDD